MSRIELLVTAVEGTLLTPDGVLTPGVLQAAGRLRSAGIQLGLVSALPPRALARLVATLGLTTPLLAFDGALVVHAPLIEGRALPLAVARSVLDCLEAAGVEVWVYRGLDWLVGREGGPGRERERRRVGFDPTVVEDLRSVLEGAVKIVGVHGDAARLARCEEELRQRLGAHARVASTARGGIEVTDAEASRGRGVRRAAELLGIPLGHVAVLGDTPEGFATAVDRLLLGRAPTPEAALGLPHGTRACLFDLDGVLTQTAKLHAVAWKQLFDTYLRDRAGSTGEPFVPFDAQVDYSRHVDGKLREDGARAFLASRGIALPAAELEELASRKDQVMMELLRREHVETYEGSVRFVRAVRQAGLRTAVVSASQHCQEVLESSGIADLFDVRVDGVVAAREHLAGKPAPDTFLAAAHQLGALPVQSAVFEDALSGVAAGRAGHFGYVVGVDRVGQAGELYRRGADIVVDDLAELMEGP